MKNFVSILVTFLLLSFSSNVSEFDSALISIKNGAVLAFTCENKSFTFELIGENIQPLEERNFVKVDNWIFQAFIIGFENPKNVDLSTEDEQKKSLSQYVMYEINYFKDELHYSLDSLNLEWGQIDGKYFYFWHFNTPIDQVTLKKQMFLTTICHDQFLNMCIPVEKSANFDDAKQFLFQVAKTIKLYDTPINFKKFSKELNKK
jgi:hypothetical protein